jgi:type IV secretory pathway TrbD component
MKPEKQQLIQDLLGGDAQRETTLLVGAQILRRRRHWRAATRGVALALVATAAIWSLEQKKPHLPSVQALSPPAKAVTSTQLRSLTDDELLALFPDTPVGLATLHNGKKLLIFPRPEDEKRFLIRL